MTWTRSEPWTRSDPWWQPPSPDTPSPTPTWRTLHIPAETRRQEEQAA